MPLSAGRCRPRGHRVAVAAVRIEGHRAVRAGRSRAAIPAVGVARPQSRPSGHSTAAKSMPPVPWPSPPKPKLSVPLNDASLLEGPSRIADIGIEVAGRARRVARRRPRQTSIVNRRKRRAGTRRVGVRDRKARRRRRRVAVAVRHGEDASRPNPLPITEESAWTTSRPPSP